MVSNKSIYDAVYPTIFATAVLGLSSIFTQTQNKTRKLKIYNLLKIINIMYISLFTYLIYQAMCDFKTHHLQANYAFGVSKLGIIFQIIIQITLTYIIYFVNILKSPKVLSSVEDIKKIDEIFEDLGERLNYHRHFQYEIIIMTVGVVTIIARGVLTHVYMSKSIFSSDNDPHLILSFPSLVSYITQNNFVLSIKLLYDRFRLINTLLGNLAEDRVDQIFSKIKSQEYHIAHGLKRIEMLMELHDFLTDVGIKINSSFNVQILTSFTAQFLTVVFSVFYLYYESLVIKNKVAALIWFVWTLWTTLEIFNVTITCHLTCKETQNTGMVIHKLLMTENEPCIKRKLMIFSQQVGHTPLQFTACGLFPIDATLIFTIVGAAATYLLIMLQFQEGIEAQCSNVTMH